MNRELTQKAEKDLEYAKQIFGHYTGVMLDPTGETRGMGDVYAEVYGAVESLFEAAVEQAKHEIRQELEEDLGA